MSTIPSVGCHSSRATLELHAPRSAWASRAWRTLIAIGICLIVAGCVWAPGQNMSMKVRGQPNSHYVKLIPITPAVLQNDARTHSTPNIPSALLSYKPQPYRIGAGDTLYITVWNHPELTSPAGSQQQTKANGRLVRPDGMIYYPFAGEVHAAGMTIEQLRSTLTQKLSTYINNPKVGVSVVNYGSKHVLLGGAFTKTGAVPVTTVPMTLGQAMASAVVDTANANLSNVLLSRDGHVYHINMYAIEQSGISQRIYLKPGDRVYVPYNDAQEIYVMGEVVHPGALRFKNARMTLTQAVGKAGGLNELTSQGKIYVIRNTSMHGKGHPGATVFELDAKSPVAFALADQFHVRPGDVVFASAAGITHWNRFLTQLLPITSAISAAAAAQYNFERN